MKYWSCELCDKIEQTSDYVLDITHIHAYGDDIEFIGTKEMKLKSFSSFQEAQRH